jgi:hypothetical protein
MKSSPIDDLRDLTLGTLAANTAVLLTLVRLGVVDRTRLLTELRGVVAHLESQQCQEPYRFCLDHIVSAIEADNPAAFPSMLH